MSIDTSNQLLGLPQAWPAPAKLNLCLHIVGRREDGYHLLQTAMQFIDLCDDLQFYQRPHGVIERIAGPETIPAELDLVVRAARLLATHTSTALGVGIAVNKRIPIQGGLGGGSSNAATVLVALNHLWRIGLSANEIAALGLKLGADVPLFVRGQAAWAEGVGEQLTPVDLPEGCFLVVKPRASVSTAEVFQAAELTRNSPITTIRAFFAEGGRNDCTSTVRGRYPEIAEALDWLKEFGDARLTGTGACVFLGVPDTATAERIRARLPARWAGYVVRGVNRSPLLDRLEAEIAR
jgi:4-diphosphocytidyl-2-C-methyl-D-erythritol kinase